MRKTLVALLALALCGGALLWWRSREASGDAVPAGLVAAAEVGPIRQVVASTGRVVSNLDVEIKCKASGAVVKLPFDVSDAVRAGDLLLELDPEDERQRVRQAEAALRASEARLVSAREGLVIAGRTLELDRDRAAAALAAARARAADAAAKAERSRGLLAKRLASLEEAETAATAAEAAGAELAGAEARLAELDVAERSIEQARQQVRIAEAQAETDRIALDLARQRLADTRVVSPLDGTVTVRSVQIGQIISSGISNVGGGTTALVVSDLSRIFVLASVDESDIGRVGLGQAVRVTVDAYPERGFPGTVARIAPRGVNVSNVVTFEVKIEVTGGDKSLLRPEMTANVEILVAEREEVLRVPADAVYRRDGRQLVTVRRAGGAEEQVEVRTGIGDGRLVEIVSGLSPGDEVLVREGALESRWRGQAGGDAERGGGRGSDPARALGRSMRR